MARKSHYTLKENFQIYLPPVVGYSFIHLIAMLFRYRVQWKFLGRTVVICLISFIGIPFRIYENIRYRSKINDFDLPEDPIFIIGHWRSGTTYLHNIISHDEHMGYVTTYQTVFPNALFRSLGRLIFRSFMRLLIPSSRKGDNVQLGVEYPQEEEFAIGAARGTCFYYFWYFPRKLREFYRENINFQDNAQKGTFSKEYKKVITKAMMYSGKPVFISKNPSNTGRVKLLLELFPKARFIYIYRNPVSVILSTRNFFDKMMPVLWLQELRPEERKREIYMLYRNIMGKYLEERSLIPEGQLIEVKFEEFEHNPVPWLEKIYSRLKISGYEKARLDFEHYFARARKYKKNTYTIRDNDLKDILEHTREYMEAWGYDLPENLEIR